MPANTDFRRGTMELQVFDVVIVGGGRGGYQAALRGAQLGMKVAHEAMLAIGFRASAEDIALA